MHRLSLTNGPAFPGLYPLLSLAIFPVNLSDLSHLSWADYHFPSLGDAKSTLAELKSNLEDYKWTGHTNLELEDSIYELESLVWHCEMEGGF